MTNFIELASMDAMPPVGRGASFAVGDKTLAVFNVDGNIYAIDNTCPHAGSSLASGKLCDNIVTCRAHGMKFDVTNGCYAGTSSSAVATYQLKIANGKILVSIPEAIQGPEESKL